MPFLLTRVHSRNGLYVIDLDNLFSPPRWLHHLTSWEVADVQWSPHAATPNWVISTSNQKALLWNLDLPSSNAIQTVIHGHSRAITDINFHTTDPVLLATSSIDSYIHTWDLRDHRRPHQSYADFFSGANQVKWSRADSHMLASSHDIRVLIWDDRNNSIPVVSIPAHSLKVNGLDFSRSGQNKLMSCSNDMTVKIWDLNDTESCAKGTPEATIKTNFPVGRARHTPFGTGCAIMPLRGGNDSLFLVDVSASKLPKGSAVQLEGVHEFKAHNAPLREFLWRYKGGSNPQFEDREFQLVTWARDYDVRLWPVKRETLEKVNYVYGSRISMAMPRAGAEYKTYHKEPEIIPANSRTTSFRMQRGSFGTSPAVISHLSSTFAHKSSRNRSTPAMMTRAAGPLALNHEPTRDHLRWVAGVRIGLSACATEPSDLGSGNSDSLRGYLESNTPANLGEELSLVNNLFPTINFEQLSITTGKLTITLNRAPSGEYDNLNELIFLRVDIQLPENYPHGAPTFSLSDNYKLSTDAIKELQLELTAFSTELTKHGKYCLEPCLRILLGEKVSLSDYLNDEELEINHKESDATDEDISNDEDGFFDKSKKNKLRQKENPLYDSQFSSSQSSLDEVNLDYMIKKSSEIPIPRRENLLSKRTSGAVWSKSGQLVCFFSGKKRDKTSNTDYQYGVDHSSNKLPLALNNSLHSYESEEDFDDSNFSHSSADEGLFHTRWSTLGRTRHWSSVSGALRYGPMENRSQPTNSLHQIVEDNQKNLIVIRDFRHMIPARPELAAQYVIMGSSPEQMCQHNSIVARKHGCIELANCWRLLEMILTTEINLNNIEEYVEGENIDQGTRNLIDFVQGKFQWGNHPYGRKWLVERLFNYFEKRQDPQMLANMSCIFASVSFSSSRDKDPSYTQVSSFSTPQTNHRQRLLSVYQNMDSETTDSPMSNFEELLQMNAALTTNASSGIPVIPETAGHASPFSKMNTWDFGSATKIDQSTDDYQISRDDIILSPEKFLAKRAVTGLISRKGSISHNLNLHGNHSNKPHLPRSSSFLTMSQLPSAINSPSHSNTTTPLVNSNENILRSNSTSHGVFNSPPKRSTVTGEKIYSPTLNIGGTGFPFTKVTSRNSIYDAQFSRTEHSGQVIHFKPPPNSCIPRMKLTIVNDELLDDESSLKPIPLLDQSKEAKYKGYRMQYAGILFSWGLEIESLEVLKFNYLHLSDAYYKPKFNNDFGTLYSSNVPQSDISHNQPKRISEFDSLHLAKIIFHGRHNPYDARAKGKGLHMVQQDREKTKYPLCQYCHLSVTEHNRYFFCLRCEHILHDTCAEDWFTNEKAVECPSGCGCSCMEIFNKRNLFFSEPVYGRSYI